MRKNGFSLIESLLSLSFLFFIVLSSLEFFGVTRTIFFKLKEEEEAKMGAFSALDKMKIDLLHGGLGLLEPASLGVLEGITWDNQSLIILSREKTLILLEDLVAGQTKIILDTTEGLKQGREICLFDSNKGETKVINSVKKESIVLSSPLDFPYLKEQGSFFLLERISFFFDEEKQTLMRKTNSSPAQPLLEAVSSFDFEYEKATNLARLLLTLKSSKEKKYETSVFPKNTGLLFSR